MQAIIFDFDGVLVDSERHWRQMDREFFPSIASGFTEKHAEKMMGLHLRGGFEYLQQELGISYTFEEYEALINTKIHTIYHELAAPIPGLLDLLKRVEHVPNGIASSSKKEWIEPCLARLKLREYFGEISTPADVGDKGKPEPDVYLRAAEILGVDPTQCIAIEDSRNGIAAAKAAGLTCIGIRTDMNGAQDLSQADEIVTSLEAVEIQV